MIVAFEIRAHVAATVDDAEYLLQLRRDYYSENTYLLYVIFESFPETNEFISVEFFINSFPSPRSPRADYDSSPEP